MAGVNKVILVGRLGADPELRHTADGVPVATFNVATTEVRRDKNGNRLERTEWHRVIAWRKLGEICGEYLKKGRLVYIEGRIQSREYEGKDGIKRRSYEIVATDLRMLPTPLTQELEIQKTSGLSQEEFEEDFPHEEEEDIPL
ncbi:MAG: single-stranded DNA-binding protein [Deltaproteobacteria bacterium]|nr:single-stranded DNA-binding protein [Deltaproteobacteria bacterium]